MVHITNGSSWFTPGYVADIGVNRPLPDTPVDTTAGGSYEVAGLHVPNRDVIVEIQAADTAIVGSALRFSPLAALSQLTGDVAKLGSARPTTTGIGLAIALEASTTTLQRIKARVQGLAEVDVEGAVSANGYLTVGRTAGHMQAAAEGDQIFGFAVDAGTDTVITAVIFPFSIGNILVDDDTE